MEKVLQTARNANEAILLETWTPRPKQVPHSDMLKSETAMKRKKLLGHTHPSLHSFSSRKSGENNVKISVLFTVVDANVCFDVSRRGRRHLRRFCSFNAVGLFLANDRKRQGETDSRAISIAESPQMMLLMLITTPVHISTLLSHITFTGILILPMPFAD